MSLETDTGGFNAGAFTTLTAGGAAAGMVAVAGLDSGGPGLSVTSATNFFGLAITPANGVSSEGYLEIDSVGTGSEFSFLDLFHAAGSVGSLTAVQNSAVLGAVYFTGYQGSVGVVGASIQANAAENFDGSHAGTALLLQTCATGQTTALPRIATDLAGNTILEHGVVRLDPAGDGLGLAVASLPTPALGMMSFVKDALNPTIGSTVANGGSAKALVWYNGANWTVIGK